ncbi:MAG: sulfurtransferase [Dehalococcoidia bacterium]
MTDGDSGLMGAEALRLAMGDARPPGVFEVSWAPLERANAFLEGHIPGAHHLDTDLLEDGYPTWRLRPVDELQRAFGAMGIAGEDHVVLYGTQFIAATRAWWVLLYAGVARVSILDGGLAGWVASGGPIEAGPGSEPTPAVFRAPPRTGVLATTEDVLAARSPGSAVVADVRSEAEFRGDVSGYEYLEARGRVPWSVHLGDADDSAGRYIDGGGRMRDPREIVASWQAAGLGGEPPACERDVIFMCGSGWRSSAAFFAAWCAGYRNIRNYSDGWCGWSTRYVPDASAGGSTPGWRQEPTANERA